MLKDGEIVERGTHSELLNIQDGVYNSMWNQQLQAADEGEIKNEKSIEDDEKLLDIS